MLVVGSDETWWTPPHSQQDVTISKASVSVPLLANPRTSTIVVGKAPAIAKIPRITIPVATIAANTVQADLP